MASKESDKSNETQAAEPKTKAEAQAAEPKAKIFAAKWLDGLIFRTSQAKKEKGDDGREHTRYVAVSRPLTQADLLDWKVGGGEVVLVTKDGRKYRVKR